MSGLNRVTVAWQGWPGSPGVSHFYLDTVPAQTSINAIRQFFSAWAFALPSGMTITVPGSGDIVEDVSGKLAGTWSVGTTPAVVTGTGGGVYAGNAGAVVHWLTGGVANNRRIRGRTFMVPLIGASYDTNGALLASALTQFQTAAAALVTSAAGNLVVWHRPIIQKGTGVVITPGSSSDVTSSRVPNLAVTLRSRRT
jgi:hypothetical protein